MYREKVDCLVMKPFSRYLRFVPVALVMGIIFFLSHQSGPDFRLPPVPGIDKIAHGVAYAVLAGALLFAFQPDMRRRKAQVVSITVVLFCLLFGISDEFHQSYIPGRIPSTGDVIADTVGAMLLVYLWFRFFSRLFHKERYEKVFRS